MTDDSTPGRLHIGWDTNTALAVIVLGALLFLVLVARGFSGFNITVS